MRLLGAAVAACLFLTLVLSPSAAQSTTRGEMSGDRAARYFKQTLCPAKDDVRQFNRRLFRGHDEVPFREIRRRLPELRRLSGNLGVAMDRTARDLANPPRRWPDAVEGELHLIIDGLSDFGYWLGKMKHAGAARGWVRMLHRADDAASSTQRPEARVKAYLDLPRNYC